MPTVQYQAGGMQGMQAAGGGGAYYAGGAAAGGRAAYYGGGAGGGGGAAGQGGYYYSGGRAGGEGAFISGGAAAGQGGYHGGAGGVGEAEAGCGCMGPEVLTTAAPGVRELPRGATVGGFSAGGAGAYEAAGCATGGCMVGEECGGGGGMMTFVGAGGGNYVTETTFRFVGEGQGDIRFVTQKRRTYCGLALCLALVLGIIVAVMMGIREPTTTQKMKVVVPTFVKEKVLQCTPLEDCTFKTGPHKDLCEQGNKVHCCAFDACSFHDNHEQRELCLADDATVNACCEGHPTAPQCKPECKPAMDCTNCEGHECIFCKARNEVHCCQQDACLGKTGDEADTCKEDALGESDCCSGHRSAPQCPCRPTEDCHGLSGFGASKCQQTNDAHCCLRDACESCTDEDNCRRCREEAHDQCCDGNHLAPGCKPPPAVPKRCIFWGDPHIVTFDGARPSFYGEGEFWIVKNRKVWIQGRYMGTRYTYGLAATNKVAIGGPFLNGHNIMVEPMEDGGKILVDGHEVCPERGCTYHLPNDLGTIRHDGKGKLVDEAASQFERHMVHLELPMGIHLTVFRWTNYLDLDLHMPKPEGDIDGTCGNMNGDASDDTTQAIFKRLGARVEHGDMLLRNRAHVRFTSEEYDMLMTCHQEKRERARDFCTQELETRHPSSAELHSCMFDECFGMDEHALHSARTFASRADREAAGEMSPTA